MSPFYSNCLCWIGKSEVIKLSYMFKKEIYIKRREQLRKSLKGGIVLLPGNRESSRNYPDNWDRFRQDSTFLYYFGLNVPDLVGVIDLDASTECLYGNDYTIDDIIWMGDQPSTRELAESVGINSTYSLRELHSKVRIAIKGGKRVHILPPYRAESLLQIETLTGINHHDIKDYISTDLINAVVAQREIKCAEEIAELDRAFDIGYEMHTLAMKMCKPNVSEREIAGAIEGVALRKGDGVSFHSIVSHNGQTLHNHSHINNLDPSRILLVDAGAETMMNYCSDNTRAIPVAGKFSSVHRDLYSVLTASFEKALSLVKAGVVYLDVHRACATTMCEGLIDLGLIKGNLEDVVESGTFALFMPHGLGHQLGLDVHDMENFGENFVGYDNECVRSTTFGFSSLRMGKRLRVGHVVTVEPGIYFIPKLIEKWKRERINCSFINYDKLEDYYDVGGMRVEDTIVVQESGARILGHKRIPYRISDIEEYMNS